MKDLLYLGVGLFGFFVVYVVGGLLLDVFFDWAFWMSGMLIILAFVFGAKLYHWLEIQGREW